MNKTTRTILGTAAAVALAAGVSVAPASAGGIYINPTSSSSTFNFNPGTSYSLFTTPAEFVNFGTGTTTSGQLTLSGSGFESGTSFVFDATTLLFSPTGGGSAVTETGKSTVTFSSGKVSITSFGPSFSGSGSTGDYVNVSAPAVPEASTFLSFGALMTLGGLAVLRRKSVKNAA